jgi:hypothetical protein
MQLCDDKAGYYTWQRVVTVNADAGAPYGAESVFTAYNGVTAATDRPIAVTRFPGNARVLHLGWMPTVVGVGAGNFTVTAKDETGGVTLCTTGNIGCTAAVGTLSPLGEGTPCTVTSTSGTGHAVTLKINCSTCTTCPLGTAEAVIQALP